MPWTLATVAADDPPIPPPPDVRRSSCLDEWTAADLRSPDCTGYAVDTYTLGSRPAPPVAPSPVDATPSAPTSDNPRPASRRRPPDRAWMDDGACYGKGTDRWYPERRSPDPDVVATCRTCPVAGPCLDYAIATRQRYGVWGGLTTVERGRLIRSRRRVEPAVDLAG